MPNHSHVLIETKERLHERQLTRFKIHLDFDITLLFETTNREGEGGGRGGEGKERREYKSTDKGV